MLIAMREERLKSLIASIHSGELSRNKDYDAFLDPMVMDARRRHARIRALTGLLTEATFSELSLEKNLEHEGNWRLHCRFPDWDFSWSAYLKDFEIHLLYANARVREVLEKHGSVRCD